MGKYVTRRLLQMIPLMLGISVIMFALIQSAPGGPEAMFLESGRFIDPTLIESYRQRLGLDQPVYIQYFKWLGAALTGDFGLSFSTSRPVSQMIAERLPATLELMLTAFTFAALIAIPLGVFSAVRQYSALDFIGTGFSFLGIAMPVFWFGLILQLIFSVQLGILPTSGRITVGNASFLDQVRHLILPGIVLSLLYVAGWSRYMRSSMLSVIRREFMLTARGKGRARTRYRLVPRLEERPHPSYLRHGAGPGRPVLRRGDHRDGVRLARHRAPVHPVRLRPRLPAGDGHPDDGLFHGGVLQPDRRHRLRPAGPAHYLLVKRRARRISLLIYPRESPA